MYWPGKCVLCNRQTCYIQLVRFTFKCSTVMQCNSTQTPTVVNGQQRKQFYSLYKTKAINSFWSGQWCCCSLSLPAEVVLHSLLPQNSKYFLPSNHKSSLRNRRLILDSCMQFKTFLAIISCFNSSSRFLSHIQKEQLYTWAPMGQNEIRTPGQVQTMWPPSLSPTAAQLQVCEQI